MPHSKDKHFTTGATSPYASFHSMAYDVSIPHEKKQHRQRRAIKNTNVKHLSIYNMQPACVCLNKIIELAKLGCYHQKNVWIFADIALRRDIIANVVRLIDICDSGDVVAIERSSEDIYPIVKCKLTADKFLEYNAILRASFVLLVLKRLLEDLMHIENGGDAVTDHKNRHKKIKQGVTQHNIFDK
jgi:hypothetical protein